MLATAKQKTDLSQAAPDLAINLGPSLAISDLPDTRERTEPKIPLTTLSSRPRDSTERQGRSPFAAPQSLSQVPSAGLLGHRKERSTAELARFRVA